MIRLSIASLAALVLAVVSTVYADSLILYMLPGDYAAYQCEGALLANVTDGQAYIQCGDKGVTVWDVTAQCQGAITVDLPGGGAVIVSCD